MRAYTVHAPPEEPAAAERFAFVKDGFSWPALLVPILWILWHRLWLTLVFYIVFVLVVAWTGRLLNNDAATLVALLGGVLFALEANNIRRLSLEGRGWGDIGSSFGRNLDEAELRFFDRWRGQPVAGKEETAARMAHSPEAWAESGDEPILGLFPEPER